METELINTENEEYGITEYIPLEDLVVVWNTYGEGTKKKCKLCEFIPKGTFRTNHFKRCYRVPMKIRKNIRILLNTYEYNIEGGVLDNEIWEKAWKMLEEEKEELQSYIDNIPPLTETDLESPELEESISWNEGVEEKLIELEGAVKELNGLEVIVLATTSFSAKSAGVLEKKFNSLTQKHNGIIGDLEEFQNLLNDRCKSVDERLEKFEEKLEELHKSHNSLCSTLGTA